MAYYIFKVVLTTGLIVAISEISKRTTFVGGLLASLPIVSYLGMIWLYVETGSQEKVADLSKSVFWLVLPSLPFFLLLPTLLKKTGNFYISFGSATVAMIGIYAVMLVTLRKFGIQL